MKAAIGRAWDLVPDLPRPVRKALCRVLGHPRRQLVTVTMMLPSAEPPREEAVGEGCLRCGWMRPL